MLNKNSKRYSLELLRAELKNERTSFDSHYRDLGDHYLPSRPRFNLSDKNRGERKNLKIIDSTGTLAARTLRSGMMSGITSPARPWFRLTTPSVELNESGEVKDFLARTTQLMSTIFLKSNLYQALPILYGDIGVFGTGCVYIEDDVRTLVNFKVLPVGSYYLAQNSQGRVDTLYREFSMTVRQIVEEFGTNPVTGEIDFSNISEHVKNLYEQGHREVWIDVFHFVMPNREWKPGSQLSKYKKFKICYLEAGTSLSYNGGNYLRNSDEDKFLREVGSDLFPAMGARWEKTGEDVYATDCPGMTGLGDVKQLQITEKRIAQAIEKIVKPPMTASSKLKHEGASILPGATTYVDDSEARGFRPTHEVNPRVIEAENKQTQTRQRISRCFFEDLFLMLANSDRREITAREISERHEEKLLALGPVLEQLNYDVLDPLIDFTFYKMEEQQILPKVPDILRGKELKVEYLSIMHQAQKLSHLAGIERFYGFVGQLSSFKPEVLDKIDADETVDIYGDITSVPPGIIVSDDKVEQIRVKRQELAQAQQQAELLKQGAGIAKDLSQANLSDDNALGGLIGSQNTA